MNRLTKILAGLLAVIMLFSLAACGETPSSSSSSSSSQSSSAAPEPSKNDTTPLVVGYAQFSSKFSPFFAETAYDNDVANMTQLGVFTTDREGRVIYNGIEGETYEFNGTEYTYTGPCDIKVQMNDDGTVWYDITMRDDLVFSDGEPMTIDDIIFSMYVVSDPLYDGSTTLYSQPIEGMKEYRAGMASLASLLVAAGRDNTDFSIWTEEQQTAFWTGVDKAAVAIAQEICDYLVAAEYNTAEDSVKDMAANWGFELADGATVEDFGAAMVESYGGDIATLVATENAGSSIDDVFPEYATQFLVAVTTGESAPSITGIQRLGDYSMRVVATSYDATMIYQLGLSIAPLHYYGDVNKYDFANNKFGFDKGDLTGVKSKTTVPLGAGPYKFVKYENGVVNFEANESYFKGAPKIKYINFRESSESDKLNGVIAGTLDVSDPSFSGDAVKAIAEANSNKEITGDVVTTVTVDNLGYGYIGINAKNVSVNGEPGSDASKNLRRAFATLLSVYRDVSVDSYYGERASIINYPISNTSWAAPKPGDDGYEVAFSRDVNGNAIYTSDMTDDQRYEAALQAALGFFEAAGYTVADGKVTAAPAGASMEYEVMVIGDGAGNDPRFQTLSLTSDALKTIGINLIINDLTDQNVLWNALDAHTQELWCAAWQSTIDPDMYQVYYADVANNGANKGNSTHYDIQDVDLDSMILEARTTPDTTVRKSIYKACLDKIIDWACEVPVYQRQNAVIFSTERVNIDTITPDMTTFYGWMAEIENTELK